MTLIRSTQPHTQSEESPHPSYRPDIDGLRAIAVLSVVIYHAFPNKLPGGFVGVDIFFVISGYLISTIILNNLENNQFNFIDFYSRRIRRIFPILLVVLFFCYVTGWIELFPDEYKQLGKHIVAGTAFASNLTLWSEAGYFDAASETKPLLHLWSLGIEEQFYLAWPLLLWFSWKRKFSTLTIIISMVVMSFGLNLFLVQSDKTVAAFYSPLSRFWELGLGSLLAWLQMHRHILNRRFNYLHLWRSNNYIEESRLADTLSCFGALLILCALCFLSKNRHFPGAWALLPTAGTWLLIASGPKAVFNRTVLNNRVMLWFGVISYPLYLWHWPLLSLPNIFGLDSVSSIRNVMLPLSILFAWGSYRFIEKPIRNGLHSNLKAISLCVLMTSVGLMGYSLYQRDGFPYRYPQEIVEIAKINPNESFHFVPYKVNRNCENQGYEEQCNEHGKPSIFLWGDSHANSLYPGLNNLQKQYSFGIDKYTGCGNPPFITLGNYTDNGCDPPSQRLAVNEQAIRAISKKRPDIIILHARWAYMHYHLDQPGTIGKLKETISRIRAESPHSKIVVLGPVPNWKGNLAHEMFDYWKKTPTHPVPPRYMRYGLVEEISKWDSFMETEVPKLGVTYLSAYKLLCNAEGCLTKVGPKPSDLTAIDYGHLSPAASVYVVSHLAPSLFMLLEPSKRPQALL